MVLPLKGFFIDRVKVEVANCLSGGRSGEQRVRLDERAGSVIIIRGYKVRILWKASKRPHNHFMLPESACLYTVMRYSRVCHPTKKYNTNIPIILTPPRRQMLSINLTCINDVPERVHPRQLCQD